jgi:hypothetical protein
LLLGRGRHDYEAQRFAARRERTGGGRAAGTGITFQQTMDLPPEELAARAFRDLARRMREVTRHGDLRRQRDRQITQLVFATAPGLFGDPGLCSATVVRVAMQPSPEGGARATGFTTETAFKVVGDIRLGGEWSAADRRTQERQCASAGPDNDLELSRAYFFTLTGAVRPAFSLEALQKAIIGARNGTYRDLACEPESQTNPAVAPVCAQPATLLARFDLTNLTQLKIEGPREGSRYLLTAIFLVPGADGPAPWQISLETDLTTRERPPSLEIRLGRGRLIDFSMFDVERTITD